MTTDEREFLLKQITVGVDLLLQAAGLPRAAFILLVDDDTHYALALGNMLGQETAVEACEAAISALEDAIQHMRPN